MDHRALADRMARFPAALRALLGELDQERALARPDDRTWSILEIVCHLADEEADDFGPRVFSTLEDPERPWNSIEPEQAAIKNRYREQDLADQLSRFANLRSASIEKLRGLAGPNWDNMYTHQIFGPISAGELMTAWCAHDALHLRQISKRLFELARSDGGYSTRYAGDW